MNKKGFMMAELVVVSSIVLVILVGLYTSYNKIYSVYNSRLRYYDVTTLYRLGYYRDVLKENDVLDKVLKSSKSGIVSVYDSGDSSSSIFSVPTNDRPNNLEDKVFMVYNNGNTINKNYFVERGVHVTFLEYIDFFNNSVDYKKFNYVMIMERCSIKDSGEIDQDNCNYAYLEIPNTD